MKKIFISSTREDLKEEREKLISFIDKMPDCKAVAMEKFSASKERSKELCLTELRGSNVIILIFGTKYGSIDEEENISFTEIEYNAAKKLGKIKMPCFVFLKQNGGEWIPDEPDPRLNKKLTTFKSRIDADQKWAAFETLDELIGDVALTLYNDRVKTESLESHLYPIISHKEFFKPFLDENKYFNHNYSLVGREDSLQDLNNFIFSDKKIAIIQGRGGIGKSKVLFEFSQYFLENNKEWELGFLNEHITLSEETITQLYAEKYIIMVDDAHRRDKNEIALLLKVLEDYPNHKVIFSCRPYGLNYIKTALNRVGIDPKEVDELPEIKELDSEGLQKLGREILGKEYQHLIKSLIRVAEDSPLVMVVGGELIKEKRINPILLERQTEFQDIVFNRFENELLGAIGDIDKRTHKEILSLISALSPIDTTNEEFYNHAADFLNIKSYELVRMINLLETSGILLRRANTVRITPDVLSDHILHNSCVTTQLQSTGYAKRVFHAFWDIMPKNLLLNLSELDWRINHDKEPYSLISDIWGEIENEFKEASNKRRFQILDYIERISIFQPARALKLVKLAINNPSKIDEDTNLPYYSQTTHKSILYKLPSILEIISHHLDYLIICCDLLWELGKEDQRQTNPNPSHAIRILSDLAKYDIYGKDLIFNSKVLECVEKWLNEPDVHEYAYSPLDIIDQFLSKEETHEEVSEYQITFYPFSVSYEDTKPIREKALTLLSECAKLDSTKTKLRVFKSLYDVLWPPHGHHNRKVSKSEVDTWIPEQIEVLGIIKNLIDTTNDPIVLIQAYSDLNRVSRALKDKQSEKAKCMADSIINSFDLQITRALWNKYDRYEENERLDHRKMLKKVESIKKQIASELLNKCKDSHELFKYLEKKLDDLEKSKVQYNAYEFLYLLGLENHKVAIDLCKFITLNPECILSSYLSAFLLGVRQGDKEKAIEFSKSILAMKNKKLILSVARYEGSISWNSSLDDEDIEIIKELLDNSDEDIKSIAIRSLEGFKGKLKPLAVELVLKLDISDKEKLAEALCDIMDEKGITIEELNYLDIEIILKKLIKIKEIDHRTYTVQRFIGYCSSKYPQLVINFLFDRILMYQKEKKTWPDRYEPLPHDFNDELKIMEHPNYVSILRKIRDKALDPNFSDYWISKLFIEVSDSLSLVSLQVLCEWINSNDIHKIEAVPSLLKHADPDFVFSNVKFVSKLLESAYSLNNDSYVKIRNKLINLTNFRIRRSLHGQPSPEDEKIKNQSQEIAERFPINSPTQKFYLLLHKRAEEAEKTPLFSEEYFE